MRSARRRPRSAAGKFGRTVMYAATPPAKAGVITTTAHFMAAPTRVAAPRAQREAGDSLRRDQLGAGDVDALHAAALVDRPGDRHILAHHLLERVVGIGVVVVERQQIQTPIRR